MERIHDITRTMTQSITCILVDEISRAWAWSLRRSQQAAAAYVGEGMFGQFPVYVPERWPPLSPLYIWKPGNADPPYGALSYAARIRWGGHWVRKTAYYATPRAAALFGGCPGNPADEIKARHELHMTEVYLRFREMRPGVEEFWYRGDVAHRYGRAAGPRVADAFIFCPCGNVEWAIESIGAYSSSRIRSFHYWAKKHGYAYQLW